MGLALPVRMPIVTDATRTVRHQGLRIRRPGRLVVQIGGPVRDGERVVLERRRLVVGRSRAADVVLEHPSVSGRHLEIRPGRTTELRDLGSKNGTWMGDRRVFHMAVLPGDVLRVGECELRIEAGGGPRGRARGGGSVRGDVRRERGDAGAVRGDAAHRSDGARGAGVGETGTGKDLAARAIHEHSARRDGPFVIMDCGALPASLAEALLFGHRKGRSRGRARVIAASQQDLMEFVELGRFREDLYFRVCQAVVELPPIRQRDEDAEILAIRTLRGLVPDGRLELGQEALAAIRVYSWPGNVRELRNAIGKMAVMATAPSVTAKDLPLRGRAYGYWKIEEAMRGRRYDAVHDAIDRVLLPKVIEDCDGNLSQAAEKLEVTRKRLRSRMLRLGVRVPKDDLLEIQVREKLHVSFGHAESNSPNCESRTGAFSKLAQRRQNLSPRRGCDTLHVWQTTSRKNSERTSRCRK